MSAFTINGNTLRSERGGLSVEIISSGDGDGIYIMKLIGSGDTPVLIMSRICKMPLANVKILALSVLDGCYDWICGEMKTLAKRKS